MSLTIYSGPPVNPWLRDDARFIYHLALTEAGHDVAPMYDVTTAVVVIARNSRVARKLAAASASQDEGPGLWQDPRMTSIRKIGLARRPNAQPARERVVCVEGREG